MPQKEPRPRTSQRSSVRGPGAPAAPATRRSTRFLAAVNDRGAAVPPAAATPRRRSPQLLSAVEERRRAVPLPAATPRRRSPRLLSAVEDRGGAGLVGIAAATPCSRPPAFLTPGADGGGLEGPPGSRRRSPDASGLRRSLRLSKAAADSGGGDPEGDCRRRSARLRGSTGKGPAVEVGDGNGLDEMGRSLGRERKGKKKDTRVAKSLGRAEVGGVVVSKESGDDVDEVKGKKKKRGISVVSVTRERRDKQKRQTVEIQEELDPQRRVVEGDSGCPRWTSKQEAALHTAYILAKPTPHFWKKVAKLVPGKSAQECFDRMHSKIVTPTPIEPRSRAKTTDCSHLGFSDLFTKDAKRSKSSKRKAFLAHKTVRHILRKHSVMDKGQEADLFSVLETSPNSHADFSLIKMSSVSEYITESPEVLQRSNENLLSSRKNMQSRFKSQIQANYTSPAVLKPVKNIVLHEKYIDELHCREARRRMCTKAACSVSSEDDKENVVLRGDVVKAAKNALVSEARGIICQLGQAQPSPSSNSENTDGSEDECEEDM